LHHPDTPTPHTLSLHDALPISLQQKTSNETYTIGGQSLSISNIQKTLAKKTQTKIRYQKLPQEQVRQMAGKNIALMVNYFNKNRSEEHTSELQSRENLVCRLLL